jgi:short-subunit dehydrogenase
LKTILLTGASSGIGRALAVQAARAGYAVYGVGRNVRALAALAAQVGEEGGTIVTDAIDISDPTNAPGLIGRAIGAFGHIDVLVNNAGAAAVGPIAMQTDEQIRLQFGTHVVGPLALTREALPALRASRGHVFMIGSGVARVPVLGMGAYPPSKAALRSATSILRRELTALDVAVTYVDPGAVDTGFMTRAGMPGAPRDVLISPEQVARKILLAIATRPKVLNVAPLQTAAVALGEVFPALAEAVLEHNPNMIGTGPSIASLDVQRDANGGRGEKVALPSARPVEPASETVAAIATTSDAASAAASTPVEPPPYVQPPARWQYEPPEEPPAEAVAQTDADMVVLPSLQPQPQPQPQPSTAVADDGDGDGDGDGGAFGANEPTPNHDLEPSMTGSSFDAALEPLQRRMDRAKLSADFVRSLLVRDSVIDVGDAAMRWAGMPNKHERALTSEVFFALAEWGYLAPRPDGRYRVLYEADGDPAV